MHSQPHLSDYRSEIDGLRAIAVLGVILFHVDVKCPGGFVGVDVFFVISGYLITSILLRDLEAGCFSLLQFWERRCRRIMPALVVMVLVTLLAAGFLLLPDDYLKLGRSALWQALFASNVYFWHDTGYFAAEASEKPLLHTWSLAVEEQFYLGMPLLLAALVRVRPVGSRRHIGFTLTALLIASLGWSVNMLRSDPASAFFLLPSRAWELLVGALLAVQPMGKPPVLGRWREISALLGVGAIISSYALYKADTRFPGLAALPPVLGAALFLAANQRPAGTPPPTWCGRLLATRPLAFIGLLSYSLYLWHWPLLAFVNYWSFVPLAKGGKLLLILLIFLLALLSWRFVETPFRLRRICASRPSMLFASGMAVLILLLSGVGITQFQGLPWRVPPGVNHGYPRHSESSFMLTHQTALADLAKDQLVQLGVPGPISNSQFVLWGDSHALAAHPAFDSVLRAAGVSGCSITHSSTAPLLDFHVKVPNGPVTDTVALNQAAFEWLREHRVRHVVLAAYWQVYEQKGRVQGVAPSDYLAHYQGRILATVQKLVEIGCQPWIMLQVPVHPWIVPKAHAYCLIFGADEKRFSATPDSWNGLAGQGPDFLRQVEHAGARIIDARSAFLDSTGRYFRISMDGQALYGDKHHLNPVGAEKMLTPVLRRSFLPIFPALGQP
ncbi:acyltransferase family protein [Prosthecobacter vanneervenii]|uniref:Peptidoglycan/LPS O-acetylase OafA/YrhL n=1 Tax=Prosthecobacter vanneervenii TaxID=48466 RepID=A0A7W7Y6E8_9BACT|nr:acyltransferase family protein [Prosthecobacter vanneervenii]MBB5030478.1 peptidoglycan/LPS O-acetylase OafA/YrhL [Prosthecobacter vanneervenii]